MFRENKSHQQPELFNSFNDLHPKIKSMLEKSWSPIYYEHVFCKIDESKFAEIYCPDNGRPNFPVNILLSLEFIKHLNDYTDEQVLEQFYYNYQVMYALGLRDLGELYLSRRTLYDFRKRVYNYTLDHPNQEDLIFQQFEKLAEHFVEVAKINTKEQRMDSTCVMPNIKRAGRLSLAFDILKQAVESCPAGLLTEPLKKVTQSSFKNDILYRSRGSEIKSKIQTIIDLQQQLLEITEKVSEVHDLNEIQLVKRFLKEQATFDNGQNTWAIKEDKEIEANTLQSAYDHDATYRKKGQKEQVGYVVNLAETCSDDNPVQFITDYTLEQNIKSDVEMLKERLPVISEKTDLAEIYTDGGYYSEDVQQIAKDNEVKVHFTDMTGRKADPEKLPLSDFNIEEHKKIIACPESQAPVQSYYNEVKKALTAHFDPDICSQCSLKENCPVKIQKKKAVLKVSQKAVIAAATRKELTDKEQHRANISKRAAIEGTNSALKRGQGADKLEVRGQVKCSLVVGMKIIGHNFQQLKRFFKSLTNVPVVSVSN